MPGEREREREREVQQHFNVFPVLSGWCEKNRSLKMSFVLQVSSLDFVRAHLASDRLRILRILRGAGSRNGVSELQVCFVERRGWFLDTFLNSRSSASYSVQDQSNCLQTLASCKSNACQCYT